MNELYVKIVLLCDERHITPYKMCKDINLSQGAITDLKKGRKETLSVANIAKIARYFNVSVDWLNGNGEREPYEPAPVTQPQSLNVTPEDMTELAEVWNTLKDRPEAKILFKSANSATSDQIIEVVRYLDYLKSKDGMYETD